MRGFTVVKRDAQGNALLSYRGVLRERCAEFICIEARFELPDRDLGYIHLRCGDLFREWFYAGRWFNIFRVQDGRSGALKGWYCNITRPPVIEARQLAADDLGLDVFVYPNGRTLLLDEDEFLRLKLPSAQVRAARQAVDAIRQRVAERRHPFDEIDESGRCVIPNQDG